jgi:hypothetical protein
LAQFEAGNIASANAVAAVLAVLSFVIFYIPFRQVQALIARATRAPYDRGPETVVDESVRKVWQLPADQVRIGGRSWPIHLAEILSQVTAGMGCTGMPVSAVLYKLLVYDTGGFFLSHRDTEKAEGMFGTSVVVLPACHRGGELIVRHGDREVTLDMSRAENSELSFAAFYADCEHEVRPITEGNRVCLVYNLILERRTKGRRLTPANPLRRRTTRRRSPPPPGRATRLAVGIVS